MRTIKLSKIKNEYVLTVPESYVKLYSFKEGQLFHLEIKESTNDDKIVFLTYASDI